MADEEGEIRCICGFTDDDGFTIQCDKCFVWQHAVCVNITAEEVPDQYQCDLCDPRYLDIERAIELQSKRLEDKKDKSPKKKRRKKKREVEVVVKKVVEPEDDREPFIRRPRKLWFRDPVNIIEEEYSCYLTDFGQTMCNRFASKQVQESMMTLEKQTGDYELPKAFPQPLEMEFKTFGLFANCDIPTGAFITTIKGVFSSTFELDIKDSAMSIFTFNGELLTPPFVFPIHSDLYLDTREYGDFDGRFVRHSCKGSNAKLSLIFDESMPKHDQFKVVLMATRAIPFGQEVFIDTPIYPHVCTDCSLESIIQSYDSFRKGDPTDSEISSQLQLDDSRRQVNIDKRQAELDHAIELANNARIPLLIEEEEEEEVKKRPLVEEEPMETKRIKVQEKVFEEPEIPERTTPQPESPNPLVRRVSLRDFMSKRGIQPASPLKDSPSSTPKPEEGEISSTENSIGVLDSSPPESPDRGFRPFQR